MNNLIFTLVWWSSFFFFKHLKEAHSHTGINVLQDNDKLLETGLQSVEQGAREISMSVKSMFMYQYSTKVHTGIMRRVS